MRISARHLFKFFIAGEGTIIWVIVFYIAVALVVMSSLML
jgi:hypothetical protein